MNESTKNRILPYASACALGVVMALAFPPFPLGFISFAGLIPILYWMKTESFGRTFRLGYWWGFGFHTAALYWIINSSILAGIAAGLYLPLYSVVPLLVMRSLYRAFGQKAIFMFPFVWTALEYLRSVGVLAFSWISVGYSLTYTPEILQFAEYVGVHGVGIWVCVINILVYFLIEHLKKLKAEGGLKLDPFSSGISAAVIALIVIPWIHGSIVMNSNRFNGETIDVSLIQGHVEMGEKRSAELRDQNFRNYDQMSQEAANLDPDLIVWPETATMAWVRFQYKYRNWLINVVRNTGIPLLAGTPDAVLYEDGNHTSYNSAVLLNRHYEDLDDEAQWYAKIRLVPFGEWFPHEDKIPLLQKIDLGQANFRPGKEYKVMALEIRNRNETHSGEVKPAAPDTVHFHVAVCFESIFPEFVRDFVLDGSQFMVVISNVNWFGKTSSLYQHPRIGVLRAIENRIGVAHCSNSGISVFIDTYGRITHSSGVYVKDILTGPVHMHRKSDPQTFYTRYGEIAGRGSVFLSIGILLTAMFLNRKRKNGVEREDSEKIA